MKRNYEEMKIEKKQNEKFKKIIDDLCQRYGDESMYIFLTILKDEDIQKLIKDKEINTLFNVLTDND